MINIRDVMQIFDDSLILHKIQDWKVSQADFKIEFQKLLEDKQKITLDDILSLAYDSEINLSISLFLGLMIYGKGMKWNKWDNLWEWL